MISDRYLQLSNLKNEIGTYLGLTGDVIGHEDAIYSSLADYYIPSSNLDELYELIYFSNGNTKESLTGVRTQ